MYKFGEVILAQVQYTDTFEMKRRPALVLFEEQGNIVVMGITSNLRMKGLLLTRKEGAVRESVIKINYIFTISEKMVERALFSVSKEKRDLIKKELVKRIG
jgi:mRNA interferase MazF